METRKDYIAPAIKVREIYTTVMFVVGSQGTRDEFSDAKQSIPFISWDNPVDIFQDYDDVFANGGSDIDFDNSGFNF